MRLRLALTALLAVFPLSCAAAGKRSPDLRLEKVVMVVRHGVRAPLDGEAPVAAATGEAWPAWPVAESRLTPHGAEGMRLLGVWYRAVYAGRGLLPVRGCPATGAMRIWTNVSARTIASGAALADGLAPGCDVEVGHLPPGGVDPLFTPLEARASPFDGTRAVRSIEAHTGGIDHLAAAHAGEIALMQDVLGCRGTSAAAACRLAVMPSRLAPSGDGASVDLEGPIRATSGTAQVFLLEYAEGLPMAQVGWGRADAATIERLGTLHKLLFDVHVRPPYMAARQTAALGRYVVDALSSPDGPKLDILVGHDTNVNALAAVLDMHFKVPGYARDDAALGGALVMERLRDRASGKIYIRIGYVAQSLDQLRFLTALTGSNPPFRMPLRPARCRLYGADLCSLVDFTVALQGAHLLPHARPLPPARPDRRRHQPSRPGRQ